MKKILLHIGIALLFLSSSCKKEELSTFNETRDLYFGFEETAYNADSTLISYSLDFTNTPDSIVKIPISLLGRPLDQDATFKIKVVANESTAHEGVDYESLKDSYTFRANRMKDTVAIKILRTTEMLKERFRLKLSIEGDPSIFANKLIVNEDKTRSMQMMILIDDILLPPPRWVSTPEDPNPGADYYLGPFSKKKLWVLNELFPWGIQFHYDNAVDLLFYTMDAFQQYLVDQKAKGTPVLEDDGTEMTAGEYYN